MRPTAWHVAYRVILSGVVFYSLVTLSFWGTKGLFAVMGWHPTQYLSQMIVLTLAIALALVVGTFLGRMMAPRQRAVWQSVMDALRNMAKGNFDVHLDVEMFREPGGEDHPFRQLAHSINDMAQELGELERMRQEFISNVSHEIQSPLTSISGFATALQKGDLSAEQHQRYLAIIESESKRLSRLSENLLKLTSLESGYHPFHLCNYRLDRQLRDAVLACEPIWLAKDVQVHVQIPPTRVNGDEDLLRQVWLNLLYNAIKFSKEKGQIEIKVKAAQGWVTVSIADTGIGLAQEDRERIFERFYKADKSRTTDTTGGGLGLAIVKKIVDMHSGTVRVESRVGIGSTFLVSWPTDVTPTSIQSSGQETESQTSRPAR